MLPFKLKTFLLCLLFTLSSAFLTPAIAKDVSQPANSNDSIQHTDKNNLKKQTDQEELIEQGSYVNKNCQVVHSPAHTKSGNAPSGATAQCEGKTYSFSQSQRGNCSGYGGVAKWL